MARNRILSTKTVGDIDARVERVLRGLGHPEPPLRLEDVRELLKLDRVFYTADDPTMIREMTSRIRIAGIQVFERPMLIIDAIRKSSLKALYLPDRKRILLDAALPELKHRWNETHEICHSLLPWHQEVMLGDNAYTLLPACHEEVEAEANFGAGRLLFLRERFTEEARSIQPTIGAIRELKEIFGNTISTTLYRFVETTGIELPIVGMITEHPHVSRRSDDFDPADPCKHFIRSPAFTRHFGRTSERDLFSVVAGYCGAQRGGPLGEDKIILTDDNGGRHRFHFETFFNQYDALTLGKYLHPEVLALATSA